jgi:hypothetical protein
LLSVAAPGSIPTDCSVDVTADLQSWLATVPDGSTVSFPPGACYRIDQTFVVAVRNDLTFEGNGATFRAVTDGTEQPVPRTRAHWRLNYSNDITIRDVNVDGPNTLGAGNPNLEAQHGFEIDGSVGVTLDGVSAVETYGDSVAIGPSSGTRTNPLPFRASADVLVQNSNFQRAGRQGISVTAGSGVTLAHNVVAGAIRSAIDLEPTGVTSVVENVLIDSNTLSGYKNYMVAGGGACAPFHDITITGNTATGPGARMGNNCAGRQNLLIQSNTVTIPAGGLGNAFVLAVKFSGVTVAQNHVIFNKAVPGVVFQGATGALTVQDNQFCGASQVYKADAQTGDVDEQNNDVNC